MKTAVGLLVAGLQMLAIAQHAHAQTSSAEAIAIARSYIEAHNAHDLSRTMAFYHPQASFQLSFDRGLKTGTEEIQFLERFDAIAQSAVFPFGLAAYQTGGFWQVTARGVVENSIVFSAMGMKIVIARPAKPIMQIRDGLIVHMEQPPIAEACLKVAREAISGASKWLVESGDPRSEGLLENDMLNLQPHLLPLIAQVIEHWRVATHSQPNMQDVVRCGTVADEQLYSELDA